MMTLMPVAAFAADPAADYTTGKLVVSNVVAQDGKVSLVEVKDGKVVAVLGTAAMAGGTVEFAAEVVAQMETIEVEEDAPSASPAAVRYVNFADSALNGYFLMAANKAKVGAPVVTADVIIAVEGPTPQQKQDSSNASISYDTSVFVATNGSDSYYVGDEVSYTVKLRDVYNNELTAATASAPIIIWAEEVSKPGVTNSALVVANGTPNTTDVLNAYELTSVGYNAEVKVSFARPGEYKVFAAEKAAVPATTTVVTTTVDGIITLKNVGDIITVAGTGTVIPQEHYTASVTVTPDNNGIRFNNVPLTAGVASAATTPVREGATPMAAISGLVANNVGEVAVKVEFDNNGKDLTGKTIVIDTNSANLVVSKATATTNALGAISFNLSAVREGVYEVYLTVDGCTWVIEVTCGNTAAAYITVTDAPQALVPLYGTVAQGTITTANGPVPKLLAKPTDGDLNIQVSITDINGNAVINDAGVTNAINNDVVGKYVTFTKKPAASKLTNKDLTLVNRSAVAAGQYILNCPTLDAEGAYEVKIVLDNGNYVTVPFTVKEFQTPVRLILAYPQNTIELGASASVGKLAWMDANGVMKSARGIELAATGYAVANFDVTDGDITVKSDEKYVGSKVTVTAVDSRYDLIATATLTVADEAAGLAFAAQTAEVNVNNKITVNVVDSKGSKVALGSNAARTDISYVVLDKPADAKVSVYTADASKLNATGEFVMALTCNKVGNVKVQAVVKLTSDIAGVGQTASNVANVNQVKYYTGVQEFAVGTGETGKSVVMSIGSNELIAGNKVTTMDAKPMIQNSRTYVPFRALAEAFGATVAYDQATSSVTAELNGVKVVMTVGSPVYTVNGVEKTADVAPFISDSRTFVPVRFAAEAFGIEVVPTYNTDGSVADVLFNM